MSTHVPGFQSFLKGLLHHFVLAKLVTSSIGVKDYMSSLLPKLPSIICKVSQLVPRPSNPLSQKKVPHIYFLL